MIEKILEVLKERDESFIRQFCSVDAYMDASGKEVTGVCRCVPVGEVLNFIHVYDAKMVTALKEASGLCKGCGENTINCKCCTFCGDPSCNGLHEEVMDPQ